ncbi:MAG: hypothetical protein ACJAT2_002877 [Bacteriovoracaceae bacterium]|jgi:hypothetical protein
MTKIVLTVLFLTTSFSLWANQCDVNMLHKSAWGLSETKQRRFLSDATLPGNQSVSEGEKLDRLKSSISKVYKGRGYGSSGPYVSVDSLASKLSWAASCTGHDFSMLAAVVKVESAYCSILKNLGGGGDSGCGQFTSAAIGFFKNQLRLPGRKENGSARMKRTIEELMSRCAPGSSHVEEDSLAKLFSKDKASIREELRTGKNISLDLLATAIYFKFYYSISGFYYDASNPAPGAFSRYNGGGHAGYSTLLNNNATQINAPICQKDKSYLRPIEAVACELSEDKSACNMTTRIISI